MGREKVIVARLSKLEFGLYSSILGILLLYKVILIIYESLSNQFILLFWI